ncbi:MAG: methylmalonyl-CoA epimerase, partial [Candidatus Marinimicrobia bacterium]|nr:methylmalonyl-CoA epimerase [Candidatus Neomarinimicrobiota bacterium]HJL73725.1 methylmalonyl-CoA epimerase [Candidatus Neomarinimicrobiota bacterium]
MKIKGIEHIGIAVNSLAENAPFWKHVLGLDHSGTEAVESEKVTTDIYNTDRGKIELLEAMSEDSTIAKYIDKRGEGVHHICLEVDDIHEAIAELQEKDINVIYNEPKMGAEGFLVTFIHPKSTGGVLVELA